MTQEIEIEFKNLITKLEFDDLQKKLFKDVNPIKQVNYYFETEDFALKRNSSALRIRKKAHQYELTLKEPHPEGLLETHDSLTETEAENWFASKPIYKVNVGKQLDALNIATKNLQYIGKLTTVRLERIYLDTIIVLDYSTYNKTEDFEFELEAKSREHGEKVFKDIIKSYNITVKPTPNKIERFYKALGDKA